MHKYLKVLGFNEDLDLQKLEDDIRKSPDWEHYNEFDASIKTAELYKEYGKGFGVLVREILVNGISKAGVLVTPFVYGQLVTDSNFYEVEHPHRNGDTPNPDILLEYNNDEADVDIVLYLQSIKDFFGEGNTLNVCAMSFEAKVILNVAPEIRKSSIYEMHIDVDDYEAEYKRIVERLKTEDLYTIFQEHALLNEDLTYSILGEITKVEETINTFTNIPVYRISVTTMGHNIDILIRCSDLLGMPSVGMRFLGNCTFFGNVIGNVIDDDNSLWNPIWESSW